MHHISRNGWCRRIAVAAGIAALSAIASQCASAWSGMYGCYGPPCVVSPLDMPLNPYAMPRRPAWGGSSFAYHVKPSPQCQLCGCGWENDDAAAACRLPYPTDSAQSFEPVKFERIGQIPHEPLLGPGSVVSNGH